MSRDDLHYIIVINTAAVVLASLLLGALGGFGAWMWIMFGQLLLPYGLRRIWPHLERVPFTSPIYLLAAGMTVIGTLAAAFAMIFRGGPFWILALSVFCLLAGVFVLRRDYRRYRRHRCAIEHICCSCGYDLRGSPERCPECGLPIPPDYRYHTTVDLATARPPSKVDRFSESKSA